ncbi:MerR family transcriptional regulator [Pseudonocardia sulfidoxydans NBRC 16205]|uniref:MerR family transcriptional regulator n=2 Tax=Pseudonocardia sulfidoxydans TaxID=54011 RepID=A0A511DNL3_9PSEU|nr:MerR family transcriptional regulator [Pseudonocardia sulfidoxydans]GEL25967.1 MerR family transcriptional regulator [Pseudonocardia sulfidoxydans NBRC 16205]
MDEDLLTIGAFSRATLLSPKALRGYHESGLLVPAVVDARTGYRGYTRVQLGDAGVIRALRQLDVPLPEIARVLAARDPVETRAVLAHHRDRMREQLARTEAILGEVDSLLTDPSTLTRHAVAERDEPALPVLARTGSCREVDFAGFIGDSIPRLMAVLGRQEVAPAGPLGALFPAEFSDDPADVTVYLPLPAGVEVRGGDGCAALTLPAARLAVVTFVGPYAELSEGYRSLGAWLAGARVPVAGPVRESYLIGPGDGEPESAYRTEIGWPLGRPERNES